MDFGSGAAVKPAPRSPQVTPAKKINTSSFTLRFLGVMVVGMGVMVAGMVSGVTRVHVRVAREGACLLDNLQWLQFYLNCIV